MPHFKNVTKITRRAGETAIEADATVELEGTDAAKADMSRYFERVEEAPKKKVRKTRALSE